jgi:hypothetical protein
VFDCTILFIVLTQRYGTPCLCYEVISICYILLLGCAACRRSLAGTVGSNPTANMDICLFYVILLIKTLRSTIVRCSLTPQHIDKKKPLTSLLKRPRYSRTSAMQAAITHTFHQRNVNGKARSFQHWRPLTCCNGERPYQTVRATAVREASTTDPHAVLLISAYFETRRVQELSPGPQLMSLSCRLCNTPMT